MNATDIDQKPIVQPFNLTLTATFENPGVFPKYLTEIGTTLVFLDLATIVALTSNARDISVSFFGWVLDKDFRLVKTSAKASADFPTAPEKPHTGERLKFLLEIGGIANVPLTYEFHSLHDAGRICDCGHVPVYFGPYALGQKFIVWAMADRHKRAIANEAEEYSGSK